MGDDYLDGSGRSLAKLMAVMLYALGLEELEIRPVDLLNFDESDYPLLHIGPMANGNIRLELIRDTDVPLLPE